MKGIQRNTVRVSALALAAAGLVAGCASDGDYRGTSYVGVGYGYGYYDPWYDRGDIIVRPPPRPPARPEHPIARPPIARPPAVRPTPLPARPMPRPSPRPSPRGRLR
jgi:hypothetical protein